LLNTGLRQLTQRAAHSGRLQAIYLRPSRELAAVAVQRAQALAQCGLVGDRSSLREPRPGNAGSRRQVTLLQAEHLPLIAAFLGRDQPIDAAQLRRNLIVSGLNLLAAKTLFVERPLRLRIGDQVLVEVTGPCEPCSKMEAVLGFGAYNALRGHGGVTARVLQGGWISVQDEVHLVVESGQAAASE
jgi:MOSC domain-containing protein YiiM